MKAALDARSHFSVGESLLSPREIVDGAKAAGWAAVALADTMTVSGAPEFYASCKDQGVEPILACRLRIVPDLAREKKQFAVYPKFYVRSDKGYKALLALLTLANDEDHFYFKPRLTWEDLETAVSTLSADDCAISTGTLYSAFRDASALASLHRMAAHVETYAEICPIDSIVWNRLAREGWRAAQVAFNGIMPLISRPVLYAPGQSDTLGVMAAISMNRKRAPEEDMRAFVRDYHWKTPAEVVQETVTQAKRLGISSAAVLKDAFTKTDDQIDVTKWRLEKMPVSLPKMAADENAELEALARAGLRERLINPTFADKIERAKLPVYRDRLDYELGVLRKLKFAGYFLLTREIVQWARANGVPTGPGRGSVGGSLVAYAIGITDVDPIRFNLLFERFINPDRIDLPDADLDFMSTRRHLVQQHIADTYGADCVAGVSNYTTMASGSALRDVGRIFGLSQDELEVSKFIPSIHGKPLSLETARSQVSQIATFAAKQPEIWSHALILEGRNRSLGRHAAGMVIAGEPLVSRAVVERRGGEATINWDKDSAEPMGLVKMDILGLSTIDMLELATGHVFKRHGKKLDLLRIPLNDANVLDIFRRGDTQGVFQWEGHGARKLLRELGKEEPLNFDDVTAASALNRPGPMDSGLLDDFVAIKQGMMTPHYPHPLTETCLKETYGVITFQEQISRIAVDLCGYTRPEADGLRKIIGKKLVDKMSSEKPKFVDGATAGQIEVELEDGRKVVVHRRQKFAVKGRTEKMTIEEVMENGLELAETL